MPVWGRDLKSKKIGTYAVQALSPRPSRITAILEEAKKWGDREFIVYGDRRISFSEFLGSCTAVATQFRGRGVQAGKPALVLGANSPEWLAAFWGLAGCGAIVAQGNAWWSADEIVEATELLKPSVIVADKKRLGLIRADSRLSAISVVAIEEVAAWCDTSRQVMHEFPDGDEEDPAVLIFTSGTTGKPKAAVLSHRAGISALHTIYVARGKTPDCMSSSDPQMTLLCSNPLFHVGGFLLQSQCLLSGHRLVLIEGRFDAAQVLGLIEREKVNIWSTVPTLLARALAHPDIALRDLRSVKTFSAAGSMVDPDLIAAARKAFPEARAGGGTTYGMTESGGSATLIGGEDYVSHPNSCGRALPGCELVIREPDAEGVGEILIRSPSAMSGYWRDPSNNIVDEEGWVHSGDLGRIDSDGYLYVVGRSKDIIIRGGENVSSSAVENALMQHPDVEEVAVLGLPHRDLGEEVAAIVVVKSGFSGSAATFSDHLTARLGYFQIPTRWAIRSEPLPVNASGKIMKAVLKKNWKDQAKLEHAGV